MPCPYMREGYSVVSAVSSTPTASVFRSGWGTICTTSELRARSTTRLPGRSAYAPSCDFCIPLPRALYNPRSDYLRARGTHAERPPFYHSVHQFV